MNADEREALCGRLRERYAEYISFTSSIRGEILFDNERFDPDVLALIGYVEFVNSKLDPINDKLGRLDEACDRLIADRNRLAAENAELRSRVDGLISDFRGSAVLLKEEAEHLRKLLPNDLLADRLSKFLQGHAQMMNGTLDQFEGRKQ